MRVWKAEVAARSARRAALLLAIALAACSRAPAAAPTPSPTPTSTLTASATSTPTLTPSVTPTPEPAWYAPIDPAYGMLRYKYAEVTSPQARVYATLEDAIAGSGNFGYLPDYPAYVAYAGSRTLEDGRAFYLVTYGWMAAADLKPLTPSAFSGVQLTRPVSFRFGWVLAETQSVNAAGAPVRGYQRYQIVHEVPAVGELAGHLAVGADEWLPEDRVALIRPEVPRQAGEICRFIYVSLAEQTLGVYEGCQLVFATLVSSGQNSWTFEGRFGVLYKVEYSAITPPAESTSEYYIEGLPYFMTYAGNFGFHGAYWHDSFGTPASHGCINLSPADARWLFDWSYLGDYVFISED
jgi:lipoprotein-anchoring transpeptidase ErfK/SrfK